MVTEEDGILYGKVIAFIPEDKVEIKGQREHVDYKKMIKRGECIACGDEVIDYSVAENYIMGMEDKLA